MMPESVVMIMIVHVQVDVSIVQVEVRSYSVMSKAVMAKAVVSESMVAMMVVAMVVRHVFLEREAKETMQAGFQRLAIRARETLALRVRRRGLSCIW